MSLTQLFTELQQEQGWNVDRGSEAFHAIKVFIVYVFINSSAKCI